MNEQSLIPYPQGFWRWLLRLPVFVYQLGLGDLMNAAHIMILTTRGRKSGAARHTPIEYRRHGSKIYVVSGWGERPQWFQNLKAAPHVLAQQGHRQFGARAEVVTNSGEALRVLHLFRRNAPFVYDPLIRAISDHDQVDARTLPAVSQKVTIVRIDPTPDAPDLSPLPTRYGWTLPTLLALGVLVTLIVTLTRSRRREDK